MAASPEYIEGGMGFITAVCKGHQQMGMAVSWPKWDQASSSLNSPSSLVVSSAASQRERPLALPSALPLCILALKMEHVPGFEVGIYTEPWAEAPIYPGLLLSIPGKAEGLWALSLFDR